MMKHNSSKINNSSIVWFVVRYLFRNNKSDISKRYFPVLALTATIGILLGIMTLIVVMSVMSGFGKEISSRLQGLNAQIVITNSNNNSSIPRIAEIKNLIDQPDIQIEDIVVGEAIVRSFTSENILATGAEIRGVDSLFEGKGIDYYFSENKTVKDGAVIGNDMLGSLAVHPDYSDELEFIAPMANIGITGDLVPNNVRINLVGVFKSGIYRYDGTIAYLPKKTAVDLLGLQARHEIELRNIKSNKVKSVANILKTNFPDLKISTWEEMNKRLFSALRLERIAMSAILLLTVIISSFSIAGATSMFVTSKRKDSALLQVLGMPAFKIRHVFIAIGAVVGVLGTVLGVLFGYIISLILSYYPLNLPAVYYLEKLPIDINFGFISLFALFGLLITIVSAGAPSRASVDEEPMSVLRYE